MAIDADGTQMIPSASATPTRKEATKAPPRLPRPPRTMTTNARMIESTARSGPIPPCSVVRAPARPAKKQPSAKTPVYRSRTFTPVRPSSSLSLTAARIIRPSPVL
jgi:hypothetical protein